MSAKITEWGANLLANYLLASAVTLVSAAGTWAVFKTDIPWFYIVVGSALVFNQVISGLSTAAVWWQRNKVAGKLSFWGGRLGFSQDQSGGTTYVVIGIDLKNAAAFPIWFKVTSFLTEFGGALPLQTPPNPQAFEAPVGGQGFYDHTPIAVVTPRSVTIEGKVQTVVEYGRRGRLRQKLVISKRVSVTFNEHGAAVGERWYDSPDEVSSA